MLLIYVKEKHKVDNMAKKEKKIGRTTYKFTDKDLKTIEKLAAEGDTIEEIAAEFGMGQSTFYAKKSGDERVLGAYQKGVRASKKKVRKRLMDFIDSKVNDSVSFNATKFWLACRDGWTEKRDIDLQNSDGSLAPKVIFEVIDSRANVRD